MQRLSKLFLGCILFHVFLWIKEKGLSKIAARISAFSLIAFLLIWRFYPIAIGDLRWDLEFIFLPSLIILSLTSRIFSKLLCFSPLLYIGKHSYEIYALHYSVALLCVLMNKLIFHENIDFTLWYGWLVYFVGVIVAAIGIKQSIRLVLGKIGSRA